MFYYNILLAIMILLLGGLSITIIHLFYRYNQVLQYYKNIVHKPSLSTMKHPENESSSDTDKDETRDVQEYVYPRITLPPNSQLRPITREEPDAPAPCENDYFIRLQTRTELLLDTSISVSYEGTEMIIEGCSVPSNHFIRKRSLKRGYSNSFSVHLNQGTPITVSETHDSIGLIKRLEADQEFKIMPGTVISVPAGSRVRFCNDLAKSVFLTKNMMICTLLPPLENAGAEVITTVF